MPSFTSPAFQLWWEEFCRHHVLIADAILRDPNEKTLLLASADELMENYKLSRFTALRLVAGIRKPFVVAAKISRAVKLVFEHPKSRIIKILIRKHVSRDGRSNTVPISVVSGNQAPTRSWPPPRPGRPGDRWYLSPPNAAGVRRRIWWVPGEQRILVGALWVLRELGDPFGWRGKILRF